MAKKKKTTPSRRRQPQYAFRCELEEADLFEEIAKREGFKSVASWVYEVAQRRAKEMRAALASGEYLVIHERCVPSAEIPNSNPIECKLVNARDVLVNHASHASQDNIANWLLEAIGFGNEHQVSEAYELSGSLSTEVYEQHVWPKLR